MEPRSPHLAQFARILFWAALLVASIMATLPEPPELPMETTDKVQHMAAFAALTLLMAMGWPRLQLRYIWLALAFFGAIIEIVQGLVPSLNRTADIFDWGADILASAVVVIVLAIIRAGLRKRSPEVVEP